MTKEEKRTLALLQTLDKMTRAHRLAIKLIDRSKYFIEKGKLNHARIPLSQIARHWEALREEIFKDLLKEFPELSIWFKSEARDFSAFVSNN